MFANAIASLLRYMRSDARLRQCPVRICHLCAYGAYVASSDRMADSAEGRMIKLRNMTAAEFSDYVAYFVPDYAAEISSNYDLDTKASLAKAESAVAEDLPQGVDTPNQVLLCVIIEVRQSKRLIGYLWCTPDIKNSFVFISDFCIFPEYRGKGYGLLALIALEERYESTRYDEIRLRVAAKNRTAERLYLRAGYSPTGINMRKGISKTRNSKVL